MLQWQHHSQTGADHFTEQHCISFLFKPQFLLSLAGPPQKLWKPPAPVSALSELFWAIYCFTAAIWYGIPFICGFPISLLISASSQNSNLQLEISVLLLSSLLFWGKGRRPLCHRFLFDLHVEPWPVAWLAMDLTVKWRHFT